MLSPPSSPTPNPYTGVLPYGASRRVDYQRLFLALCPRDSVRVDTRTGAGAWKHAYRSRALPTEPPRGPWAVPLTDTAHRFRWLCFDLDGKRGEVGPDLATLLRWLEEAGLTYVVAASGAAGGRHVWVTCGTPLDALLVRAVNEAAAKRLPTLDPSVLNNARTGAVRPIGAAHRTGGRSELVHPLDEVRAAALLAPATCRNPGDAFSRLLLTIDAVPAPVDVRPRRHTAEPATEVLRDDQGPRLPGTPSTLLDEDTMALLIKRPPEDRVSEVLASLLTKLALRRWTWPMVRRLLTEKHYREGGLLHACTRRGSGCLRTVLDDTAAAEKLKRQWERCVVYAATLPLTTDSLEWTERIGHIVTHVEQVQGAADACPERWATQSGPADRAALDLYCLLALRAGTTVLDLDVRRAALATGHGRSTMHRALRRLALDGWLKPRESDGPAATHELLPVTTTHPGARFTSRGGTQGTPPPGETDRSRWLRRLEERLALGQADVFSYSRPSLGFRGGLGHHAGRVYQQLAEQACRPLSIAELCGRTGYGARTVARHLARMRDLMMTTRAVLVTHHECPACGARPGHKCRTAAGTVQRRRGSEQHAARRALAKTRSGTSFHRHRAGSLVAAAKALGVHGRAAARARWYAVEVELYRWWEQEETWMREPKKDVRTGPRVHAGQGVLRLTTLPGRARRPYPRTVDGRGDHGMARERVLRCLVTA